MLISDINTEWIGLYINTAGGMKASWPHQTFAAASGCHPYKAIVKKEMASREGIPVKYEKLYRKQQWLPTSVTSEK